MSLEGGIRCALLALLFAALLFGGWMRGKYAAEIYAHKATKQELANAISANAGFAAADKTRGDAIEAMRTELSACLTREKGAGHAAAERRAIAARAKPAAAPLDTVDEETRRAAACRINRSW